jgi:hypothetical protein
MKETPGIKRESVGLKDKVLSGRHPGKADGKK